MLHRSSSTCREHCDVQSCGRICVRRRQRAVVGGARREFEFASFFCDCLSIDSSNLEMCVRIFISKSTPHGAIFHFTFISRSTTLLLSSICSRLFVCCSRSLFIPRTQGNKYRTAKRSWYKSQKIDSVSFAIWIEMKMFLQRSTLTSLTRLYL